MNFNFFKKTDGTSRVPKNIQDRVDFLPDSNIEVRVLADKILQCIPGMSVTVKDVVSLKYVRANQEACSTMCFPETRVLGKTVYEIVKDQVSARLMDAADREAIRAGKHEMEFWCSLNDGTRRRLKSTRFVFEDEYTGQKYVVSMQQDVTSSHSATMKAEDLERTTNSLLAGLPFPILWLDRQQVIKGNNLAFNALVGVDMPLNHNLIDTFPFVVAERIKAVCKQSETENKVVSQQITLWSSGSVRENREYVVHVCPMHDMFSQVIGTVVTLYDVTDLVTTTSRVSEQVRLAFDVCTDAVLITNNQNKIVYANQEFIRQYGYVNSELVGQAPPSMKSDDQNSEFYKRMWETLNSGRTWQGQMVNITKDKRLINSATTIVPLMNGTSTPLTYLIIKHIGGNNEVTNMGLHAGV